MLVAASPLLVGKALVLVDLFADLVGNWQHELWAEAKVCTEALCKVLR